MIDKENNKLTKINETTFSDLGFKERNHIQEWIAKNPECLDEDLLIIQKEFDGFDGTSERLDLLALDRSGALVIIENKRDDSGKDVTWQALKYVSYCSTLSKTQIVGIYQDYLDEQKNGEKAKEKLADFFKAESIDGIELNNQDQKIILVAGNFRKEVTSTAMWLINHNIDVRCFKATPYKHGDDCLLDIEQIIPVKEAADYYIKMADKNKESQSVRENNIKRWNLRKRYWEELLEQYASEANPNRFENINATTEHWLSCGSGVSGISFTFIFTTTYASVEVGINHGTKDVNDAIYRYLFDRKDDIEKEFGSSLQWNESGTRKTCSIGCYLEDVSITDENKWEEVKAFHCKTMPSLDKALRNVVKEAKEAAKVIKNDFKTEE